MHGQSAVLHLPICEGTMWDGAFYSQVINQLYHTPRLEGFWRFMWSLCQHWPLKSAPATYHYGDDKRERRRCWAGSFWGKLHGQIMERNQWYNECAWVLAVKRWPSTNTNNLFFSMHAKLRFGTTPGKTVRQYVLIITISRWTSHVNVFIGIHVLYVNACNICWVQQGKFTRFASGQHVPNSIDNPADEPDGETTELLFSSYILFS
jgi:hypothetical protein